MKKYFLTIISATFLCFQTNLNAKNVISSNDTALNPQTGVYKIIGDDPFVVFKPIIETKAQDKSAQQFLVFDQPLHVKKSTQKSAKNNEQKTTLQLFFKQENGRFDPQFIIEFTAPNTAFKLKIPLEAKLDSKLLRLDINDCRHCSFNFNDVRIETGSTTDSVIVTPDYLKNGSSIIDANNGFDINTANWSTNHIDGELTSFTINGPDPFIASQELDVSSNGLGGVYFKIKRPLDNNDYTSFQLFYATENNPFKAQYSSIARLKKSDQNTLKNELEIVFPLAYLNLETPKDLILKRVRLDLPLVDGQWSLLESKLLHQQQLPHYSHLIPKQLLQQKRQRLTGKRLLKKALQNITADKGFVFGFVLLNLLVIGLCVRAYRR